MDVAQSKLFKVLVGPQRQEFTIHSALLVAQSPMLSTLVQGHFREATDEFVVWDDIDERTFFGFWQYAYTGDYDTQKSSVSDPSKLREDCFSEPSEGSEDGAAEDRANAGAHSGNSSTPEQFAYSNISHFGVSNYNSKNNSGSGIDSGVTSRKQSLWDNFRSMWAAEESEPSTVGEEKSQDHFTESLLHHARVYAFADRYIIPRLKHISFQKLHVALLAFDISEENMKEIMAVLSFCFKDLAPDKLKLLMVHYTACKIEDLWEHDEFQALLEECGSFSKSIIGSMLQRLD